MNKPGYFSTEPPDVEPGFYSNHWAPLTPDDIKRARSVINGWIGQPITCDEPMAIVPSWIYQYALCTRNESGLERPSDAAYHAGEWTCGEPGMEYSAQRTGARIGYMHHMRMWVGLSWGCGEVFQDNGGLEREDSIGWHAGPWPCGIPGCDALEWPWPLIAPVADYVHRSKGWPWGCAPPWLIGSWLEREDSTIYHIGPWPMYTPEFRGLPVSHWTAFAFLSEAWAKWHDDLWGDALRLRFAESTLEREDSIEYHAGPWRQHLFGYDSAGIDHLHHEGIWGKYNRPWGCGAWIRNVSGLEREDTIKYHAGQW